MTSNPDQQAALDLHNAARAAVGVGPLVWDQGLADAAQAWANQMNDTQTFAHDPNAGTGENIFWESGGGSPNDLQNATNAWLGEQANYHGQGSDFESTGHYTQCVWQGTTNVGIAANGGYVCGRYTPAGNVEGQDPYPMNPDGTPTNTS